MNVRSTLVASETVNLIKVDEFAVQCCKPRRVLKNRNVFHSKEPALSSAYMWGKMAFMRRTLLSQYESQGCKKYNQVSFWFSLLAEKKRVLSFYLIK